MGLQIVVFGAKVYQIIVLVLQGILHRLSAHVEAAIFRSNGVVFHHRLLYIRIHRIAFLTEGALLGGHQTGSGLLFGDAVIKPAADIVGVLASKVEQGDGLGSSLAAVAVNHNRDVVRNLFERLSNCNAVWDVDCALDMTGSIIIRRANIQYADVLACRYLFQKRGSRHDVFVCREVCKVVSSLFSNAAFLLCLLLNRCICLYLGGIYWHCADAHGENQSCNEQFDTDLFLFHFHFSL